MARVTGKYDVDFERGEGGLSSVFGTYIGTRLKEGKEQYERELKAADPSSYLKRLEKIQDERSKILSNMKSLKASSTAGGSYSETLREGDLGDRVKYAEKFRENNREKQSDFETASLILQNETQSLKNLSEKIKEGEYNEDNIRTAVNDKLGDLLALRGMSTNIPMRHAMGMAILDATQGLPQKQKRVIYDQLAKNKATPSEDDFVIYDDPDQLTAKQEADLDQLGAPQKTRRFTSKKAGPGMDPNDLLAFYASELARLDKQYAKAYRDYEDANEEYKRLAKGPGRNLALAPISSRPSALSEALGRYADLRDVDPAYGEDIAEASVEAGRFTMPDRFEDLTAAGGSGGKAPIDILLGASDNLATLRGSTKDPGDLGVSLRSFDSEDVDLVRGNLQRMLQTIESPMFAGQQYGKIDSGGEKIEIGKYLSEAISFLDEVEPEMKAELAQEFSDELINWRRSQSETDIRSARAAGQPGYAVSRSIENIKKAKKDYDEFGDSKPFRDVVANEYNVINSVDREVRGDVGDAFLSQVDNFIDNPDIDYLDATLNNLQNVADSIAAEGSGVL